MKICQYEINTSYHSTSRLGILSEDEKLIIDPNWVYQAYLDFKGHYFSKERAHNICPSSLSELLKTKVDALEILKESVEIFKELSKNEVLKTRDKNSISHEFKDRSIKLKKPLDKIGIYRDFYTHEGHVKTGFAKRNESVPSEWYEMPVFYKGATAGFIGPEENIQWPSYSNKLDYELELAAVIGKDGKNIKSQNALSHVFGFTILNDISARDIQKKEMAVRLGPAKGKDFCSIIGPVITTIDDFNFNEPVIEMTVKLNGKECSKGNSSDAHYTFSQMIEHASKEEWLLAGDLIGSGTVTSGCALENNVWPKLGDTIEMTAEKIGSLKNTFKKE